MSKDTNNKTPRGEHTGQPDTEYKDFPRFNAFVNKVRTESKLTRGVANEQEEQIQATTL